MKKFSSCVEFKMRWPCLRKARQTLRGAADATFRRLAQRIDETRIRELLGWLRDAHRLERIGVRRAKMVVVFGKYLRSFLTAETFAEMESLQLPAQDGSWRSGKELCVANDGVASCHVVASDIENSIADLLPAALTDASPFAVKMRPAAQGFARARLESGDGCDQAP